MAKSQVELMLNNAGFKNASIGSLSLNPLGISARNIKLDEYNADEIKSLDARVNWISFLLNGDINELRISGVSLTREPESLSYSGQQLLDNLLNLPTYRMRITDVTLDLGTMMGAIRANIEATVNDNSAKTNIRNIKARITAAQYQLALDSTWEGTLTEDGALDLAGTIAEGKINVGPLRISRFNGWAAFSSNKKGTTLQSDIEAGSATFMGIPLHNISVVNDLTPSRHNMIIRSGVSGMPDVLFAADVIRDAKKQSLTSVLKGKNLGRFLNYIAKVKQTNKDVGAPLLAINEFRLLCDFEPEKRFVGGPLPFSVKLMDGTNKKLEGNMLFYPDTFDVRGSLETDTNTADALQSFFKIPSENMKQNFIRLDGNAKHLLQFEEEPSKTP